jgi:hypothetical protein
MYPPIVLEKSAEFAIPKIAVARRAGFLKALQVGIEGLCYRTHAPEQVVVQVFKALPIRAIVGKWPLRADCRGWCIAIAGFKGHVGPDPAESSVIKIAGFSVHGKASLNAHFESV